MAPTSGRPGDERHDVSVYGHNLPEERIKEQPGIREASAPEQAEIAAESTVHAVDDNPDLEETPMPPRHAPLSDEVPS